MHVSQSKLVVLWAIFDSFLSNLGLLASYLTLFTRFETISSSSRRLVCFSKKSWHRWKGPDWDALYCRDDCSFGANRSNWSSKVSLQSTSWTGLCCSFWDWRLLWCTWSPRPDYRAARELQSSLLETQWCLDELIARRKAHEADWEVFLDIWYLDSNFHILRINEPLCLDGSTCFQRRSESFLRSSRILGMSRQLDEFDHAESRRAWDRINLPIFQ